MSKLADYSTVIVSALALEPERLYSAKALAKQVQIAAPTVSKLLKLMVNAGIVNSACGALGGYQLAAPPRAITIAQVVAAIEGKPALTECSLHTGSCRQDSVCAIKSNWRTINQLLVSILENVTIEDMLNPLVHAKPEHVLNDFRKIKIESRHDNE